MRSANGASYYLLRMLGSKVYEAHLTVPLYLEYEEQVQRLVKAGIAKKTALTDILDYICEEMVLNDVYFLWRPFLKDRDDDMVLEAAVAGHCSHIVTHNIKDFKGIEKFGIAAFTPAQFLQLLRGEL